MSHIWRRVSSLNWVLLSLGAVWASGAGAQDVPTQRSVPPPIAESTRGFTSITSVRELDGGRTLAADYGEQSLYLVNWETGAIEQVSRQGEGPGEYRDIGWLYAMGDDQTILTDPSRRWILFRDTVVLYTFTRSSPLNRRFRGRLEGVTTDGSVLGSVSAEDPGIADANERVLELAASLGPHRGLPRLDTLRRVKGAGRDQLACVLASTRGAPRCRFLEAEEQAILFPDGWTAVALQDPYRIDWRSPDGAWIRGEMLDSSVAVSEAEKCAAIYGWAPGVTRCETDVVESYVWPETIPPFLAESWTCRPCLSLAAGRAPWLFAGPQGRVVVRRTPQASRRGNLYDIVDRTGRLVERVTLPHGEAIVGFGESSVYTIRMDPYDLQWLRRHPWRD